MTLINQIAIAANKYNAKFNSNMEGGNRSFIPKIGGNGNIASKIGDHFLKATLFLLCTLGFRMVSYSQAVNNLVTNGSFENTTCGNFTGCLAEPFNANVNCVTDWKAAVGTPNLCRTSGGLGAFQGTNFASCSSTGNFSCRTESFGQDLTLFAGQPYTIEFACRTEQFQPMPEPAADIVVYGKTTALPGINGNGTLGNCPSGSSYQQLALFPDFLNFGWTNLSKTFTPSTNLQSFIIWPYQKTNKTSITNYDAVTISCTSLMDLGFTVTHGQNNTVQFTGVASSSISGLTVARWLWDFGDGSTSTEQNPSHTYSSPLSRSVCLEITDIRGCTKRYCSTIEFPGLSCFCTNGVNIDGGANGVRLSSLNLPSNLSDQNCLSIRGKLIVDANWSLSNISRILMGSGSEVEIVENNTLTINQTSLYACDKMWKGISVGAGCTLSMEYSTISDAENAIFCKNLSYLNLNVNQFISNHVGLRIDGVVTPVINSVAGFKNNSYLGGTLIAKYPGQALTETFSKRGVYISNCPTNLVFTNSDGKFSGGYVQSSDLPQCFYISGNSSLTTSYQKMVNCEYGYYNSGSRLVVNFNVLEDSRVGIFNLSCNSKLLSFNNNTITASVGIQSTLLSKCSFTSFNNTINTKRYKENNNMKGVWLSNNSISTSTSLTRTTVNYKSGTDFVGFQFTNSKKADLTGNIVNGSGVSIDNQPMKSMTGVLLEKSDDCVINGNQVQGNSTSLGDSYQVAGSNKWLLCGNTSLNNLHGFVFYSPSESAAGLRNNTMKRHSIGLEIDGSTIIGKQYLRHPSTFTIDGLSNIWEMNQFAGQIGLKASPAIDFLKSQFRVKIPPIDYRPAVVDGPFGIVTADADNNNIDCFNFPFTGDGDEDRARGNYTAAEYVDASRYMIQRRLYESILTGTTINTPNSVIDSFYQANELTNLGKFAQISQQIDQYIENDQYDAMNLHGLQNMNNAIMPAAIWEENEKTVNAIWINKLLAQTYEFSDEELLSLHNVAMQCPRSNGLAVYVARGLYGIKDPNLHFEDNLMCLPEVLPRAIGSTKAVLDTRITPNPTNGLVSIELPISDKRYTLIVFDVLGNLMLNQAVTNGHSVDLSTFVSGMYIFRIAEEEKIIKSEKIIKLD